MSSIGPGSLPRVHPLELSPHVSHSQGQSAVVSVLGQFCGRKGVGCLKPSVKSVEVIRWRGGSLIITAISPFIASDVSQATPHASGVRAELGGLQLVPVFSYSISDGRPKKSVAHVAAFMRPLSYCCYVRQNSQDCQPTSHGEDGDKGYICQCQ